MANENADIALDFDREKKRMPIEFWKKENGDRFKINSPILRQRYGLKLGHHMYLTHLNALSFRQSVEASGLWVILALRATMNYQYYYWQKTACIESQSQEMSINSSSLNIRYSERKGLRHEEIMKKYSTMGAMTT